MFPNAAEYIPVDLIISFLLLLPIGILLRLYYVSKAFRSIINSPYFISLHFISLHFNKKPNQTRKFIFRHYDEDNGERFLLLDVTGNKPFNSTSSTPVNFPYEAQNGRFFFIVGSCRGIVCLADDVLFSDPEQRIFLWNPRIRRHRRLPVATIEPFPSQYFTLGFGYSDTDNDFKVVRFITFQPIIRNASPYILPPKVEIFSVKTWLWRTVEVDPGLRRIHNARYPVFLNGAVCWLASSHTELDRVCQFSILAFHISQERFDDFPLPRELQNRTIRSLSLTLMGESLVVIDYRTPTTGPVSDLWVMEQYGVPASWKNSYSCPGNGSVVALRQNKEALVKTHENGLVARDLESTSTTMLGLHGVARSLHITEYDESIELLSTGQVD